MAGKRTDKVAKQLQKDLGEILDSMRTSHFKGAMVTVMGTEISPDLGFLKVYVSIFPISNTKKQEVFSLLEVNIPDIRHQLAQRVRNQLRKVPELAFYMDETIDRAQRLEALFRELKEGNSQKD